MRKGQLLNVDICYTLARLGHTDRIEIADVGLPIPDNVSRIDIVLNQGVPSFLQAFGSIVQDMQIEQILLASELAIKNLTIYHQFITRIQ